MAYVQTDIKLQIWHAAGDALMECKDQLELFAALWAT